MSKELVRQSIRNRIGLLTINSNDFNTLTGDTIFELGRNFELLQINPEVGVIVISGYPKSFFSAGADVKEIANLAKEGDKTKVLEALKLLQSVFLKIENSAKPVVAAINGYCLGGGLELALACKYRIAISDATLGLPEIGLGIIPGLGGTQRLHRLIGNKNAAKILFGGKKAFQSGKTAKEMGLVDRIIEGGFDFIMGVKKFIEELEAGNLPQLCMVSAESVNYSIDRNEDVFKSLVQGKASSAVAALIRAVNIGSKLSLVDALLGEHEVFAEQLLSSDGIEGVSAYIEKRTPKFSKVEGGEVIINQPEKQPDQLVTSELTEEYAMLRQTLKEFGENEIRPKVDEMEKEGNIFPDIIAKMAELGLFGVPFADTYGGAGLGKTGYCIMMEELCRVHGSMAVLVGASVGLTGGAISIYGTEAQKQKYLRAIAEGKSTGAFALTEAEAGSDVANMSSTAEKRGNKWVINGTKQFISNGDIADVIVVFAKTDKDLGANGITAFIVEKSYPGFKTTKVEHKMGIRASRTTSMEFTDMEVPEENVLGQLGQGFKIAMNVLNYGRLSLAAGCLGASKRAFELAYAHASQRSQMGSKLLEFQIIQSYFARMRSDIFMMESSIYPVVAMADRGEDIRLESAIVKLTASEMSGRVIDTALQIHGGLGYMDEYEISRLYRDARVNPIFEGTNEIQQLLIFKEIFKSGGKI